MSEAEIIDQIFNIYDRYWVIVQWWASVSFGIIVVAHFASNKLSATLLSVIIVLYTIYSLWLYLGLSYNLGIADGFFEELRALDDSGELSQGGRNALQNSMSSRGVLMGMFTLLTTFCACVGYLVYAYIHGRNST